jgi:hypothetical protein
MPIPFYRILILEDDLETLGKLINQIERLEKSQETVLSVSVFSEYWQVVDYLNINPREKFDVILLDRDCKKGGSFHVLNIEKFKPATIIGISSVPEYNQKLKELGITQTVDKNYNELDTFARTVGSLVEQAIDEIKSKR